MESAWHQAALAPAIPAPPARGRVFTVSRGVRSTDVTKDGRLRLDAVARYLQDVAEDDLADAALDEPYGWLLRRMALVIRGYPAYGEAVWLRTYCSATGPRWAERTTTLAGPAGDLMQARALWVAVTRADGQPAALAAAFHRVYGETAAGRQVSTRLSLPGPPASPAGRPWPLRATDIDTVGHVNNSVHWAAVEDVLAGLDWLPASAELDYNRPVLPGHHPQLVTSPAPGQLGAWLLNGTQRLATVRLRRQPPGQSLHPDQ
jgi:acyl-ACP thioesterase